MRERGQQAEALSEWSQRLRLPMALDDAAGARIGASESYLRRSRVARRAARPAGAAGRRPHAVGACAAPMQAMRPGGMPRPDGRGGPVAFLPPWPHGAGLVAVLLLLFVAVAAGAYPVVRRLTRRLKA